MPPKDKSGQIKMNDTFLSNKLRMNWKWPQRPLWIWRQWEPWKTFKFLITKIVIHLLNSIAQEGCKRAWECCKWKFFNCLIYNCFGNQRQKDFGRRTKCFHEAWNHPTEEPQRKWCKATKKKLGDDKASGMLEDHKRTYTTKPKVLEKWCKKISCSGSEPSHPTIFYGTC